MKAPISLPRIALLGMVAVSAILSSSCHHYDDYGYYNSGYGVGGNVPVHYYVDGGVRYGYGTGPWYPSGIYHGPTRYYTVSGRRYVHGHGPWYNDGRYIVVNRHPGQTINRSRVAGSPGRSHIVSTPGRSAVVRTPGRSTVIRTPGGHGSVRKLTTPNYPSSSSQRRGAYTTQPNWGSRSPWSGGSNSSNRSRRR